MTDESIDKLLRKAPEPAPPEGLLQRLTSDITLPDPTVHEVRHRHEHRNRPIRFWLPAFGFTGCLLVCAVLFAVQTGSVSQLQRENESLRAATRDLDSLRQQNVEYQQLAADARELDRLRKENQELNQLRAEVAKLRGQVQDIARLQTENQQLQAGLATANRSESSEEFFNRVPDVREKSDRIRCVNNLKQIGLAARIWASDHSDVFPSDFVTMMNELSTPRILHCPADGARPEVSDWQSYTAALNSYEMLSPGIDGTDPQLVYVRCTIHNNVCLADGSVQQLGPGRQVMQKDGRYYISDAVQDGDAELRRRYGLPPAAAPASPQPNPAVPPDEALRQRYGLPPSPKQ